MTYWARRLCGAAVIGILSLGTSVAKADPFNVNLFSVTNNGNATFTFNYELILANTESLTTGDYFTIYDFAGFTGSGVGPAGFTFSSANLGVTPASQILVEDPTVPNLTFTYNGATPITAGTTTGFQATSIFDSPVLGRFSIRGTDSPPNEAASPFEGNGGALVPTGNGLALAPTLAPEPGEWATMGFGALCVGGLMLKARRRRGAAQA